LQNYDADKLRTHELHWHLPCNWFLVILDACKILSQLQVFHIAFLYLLLPFFFLARRSLGIKRNKLAKNRPILYSSTASRELCYAKATAFVKAGQQCCQMLVETNSPISS